MLKQDFYFDLPENLIAQNPTEDRTKSRLMTYKKATQEITHHNFFDLSNLLQAGDLLVLNDSKVMPARLFAKKETGGAVELLLERIVDEHTFLAQIKSSKKLREKQKIYINESTYITVLNKEDDLYLCESLVSIYEIINNFGHIPLPPYITRKDNELDKNRYQTVYAKTLGSVAAPTAGLHFDNNLLQTLATKGIEIAHVTLHVGAGTFQPVRCENIIDHKMHTEHYHISVESAALINNALKNNKRVIAVGTTALRTLESACDATNNIKPGDNKTEIFIYPGYKFKICSGLITNFHLPESTLLMLVSAFIGYKNMMSIYHQAIENNYRFFSYGDATLLL